MPDKIKRLLKKEIPAQMSRKQAALATLATAVVFFSFLALVDWLSKR